jgi:phosphoribosylformylglycinamidine cyclo-ligase
LAHITGGGLTENIPRVLPDNCAAHLKRNTWPRTELFTWLQTTAGIDEAEMCRTFNNGIGMVLVLDPQAADACAKTLTDLGEQVFQIGVIANKGVGAAVVIS